MKVKFIAPANVLSDSRHIHLSPNRLYSVLEAVYYPILTSACSYS